MLWGTKLVRIIKIATGQGLYSHVQVKLKTGKLYCITHTIYSMLLSSR